MNSEKCVYTLDPFDEFGFRPHLHNSYTRIRFRTFFKTVKMYKFYFTSGLRGAGRLGPDGGRPS